MTVPLDNLANLRYIKNSKRSWGVYIIQIETKRLYIRQLADNDFDLMCRIWKERFPPLMLTNKTAYEDLLHGLWNEAQTSSVLTGLLFLRSDDVFCGRVNMQYIDRAVPEVGVDILRDYRNHGYGPEAVTGFVNWYGSSRCISQIKVCISSKNAHSIHVFEKLGAEFLFEKPMFSEKIQRMREELPKDKARIVEDIVVREYILKLPIGISFE